MANFVVVENAGYEGEKVFASLQFKKSSDAWKWIKKHYDEDEIDSLHVEVALVLNQDMELTYEY